VTGAATLVEALEGAPATPAELIFHAGGEPVRLSAASLLDQARAGATLLASRGVRPGDAVGVLGPNRPEWARWAFATWLAGAVLVPLPYHLRVPDPELMRQQIGMFVRSARCRAVLADPSMLPFVPANVGMRWDVDLPRPSRLRFRDPRPEDVAVIQFTSGSTAAPKGAVLPHRAVLAGIRNSSAGSGEDSTGWIQLSWLPFFHDWALFGYLVWSVVMGTQTHILPTERFARDPSEWLRLVGTVGAMMTPGPSSAWDVALRVAGRRPEGIDLSSLRVCTLAAEMIEPRVLDRLVDRGGPLGLRPEALNGAYGLAEATLAVTLGRAGGGIRVDLVDPDALVATGRALPEAGSAGKSIASCGSPVPDARVAISGPAGWLPERHVGEILLRGPSLMQGYLGEHEDPFVDGWMRTGDQGYLADGELFVTGRTRDVVIVMGRNYAAQDLEWAAERVEGVRQGRSVAFVPEGAEGEAVLVVEASRPDDVDALPRSVWREVSDSVGVVPREVLVLPGGSVPMTTSGKLRRSWVREAFATRALDELVLARGPGRSSSPAGAGRAARTRDAG
jgi:acyl-CoA synthetase (AMP-forming)/AMP-acid ligase II